MSLRPGLSGVVAVLSVAMVVAVGVVLWPRGTETVRGPGPVALESMPSAPSEQWRWTAGDLFGEEFAAGTATILLEDSGVAVVRGETSRRGHEAALIGLDAETGELLWDAPWRGESPDCVVGVDGRLGCVRNVGERMSRLDILDLKTGEEAGHSVIEHRGRTSVMAVDGGFVVMNKVVNPRVEESASEMREGQYRLFMGASYRELPDLRGVMTGLSSDGRKLWTVRTPLNHVNLQAGSYGDVIVVGDQKSAGFSVYRIDSGQQIYHDGADRHSRGIVSYVVYPDGFAVSHGGTESAASTAFFRNDGSRDGVLNGWRVLDTTTSQSRAGDASSTQSVPVLSRSGDAVGMVSAESKTIRWTIGQQFDRVQRVDVDHLVVSTSPVGAATMNAWRLVDVATGAISTPVSLDIGEALFGFDGERLLFLTDPAVQQGPSTLSAYDPATGRRVWRVELPSPTARWTQVGTSLYAGETAGSVPSFVARYASH